MDVKKTRHESLTLPRRGYTQIQYNIRHEHDDRGNPIRRFRCTYANGTRIGHATTITF